MKAKSHKKALLWWFLSVPVITPVLTYVILKGIHLSFFEFTPLAFPLNEGFINGVLKSELYILGLAAVFAAGIILNNRFSVKLAMILTVPPALFALKILLDNLTRYSDLVYKVTTNSEVFVFGMKILRSGLAESDPANAVIYSTEGFLLEFVDFQNITLFLLVAVIAWCMASVYHGLAWLHYTDFPESEGSALPATK